MSEDKLPSKKHVQVPNNMTGKDSELEPRDLLVYANIKKYINYKTNETFVGLEKIASDCNLTIPTIRKSINILKEKEYITVEKRGRSNVYTFNPYKNFEPFSYEFLNKDDLESNEKAYIITSQPYMFKNIEGYGKLTYTNEELGKIINLSGKTIQRLDKSLMEKGYLNIIKTTLIDKETGLKVNEKIFHLNELEQAVIWTLRSHEERLDKTDKTMELLLKKVNELEERDKNMELLLSSNGIDISKLTPPNVFII